MFRKNGYMSSFDLKSGYHHVEIFQPHQTFLGFSWEFQEETRFYVFTVLPFGLSVAPCIFTTITRPLVGWWRANGIYIAVFLDDGWSIAGDYNSANFIASRVRSDIHLAGFITNSEKSIWEPTQIITWLGLVWNSTLGTISSTPRRVKVSLIVWHLLKLKIAQFRLENCHHLSGKLCLHVRLLEIYPELLPDTVR